MENPFSHTGRLHKHTCNFFKVCCFLFLPSLLLTACHWLLNSALQKADKETALTRLALPQFKFYLQALLLHFKLHSYVFNTP